MIAHPFHKIQYFYNFFKIFLKNITVNFVQESEERLVIISGRLPCFGQGDSIYF